MRALVLTLAMTATGCGGSQRPGPPRSTCAEAAASIARGLRTAAPTEADRVAELEPRFADACRTSRWRPNVVRCFAIARDLAEHRICARRMAPDQRDEARLIQGQLHASASRRPSTAPGRFDERCISALGPAIEGLLLCDQLSPFEKLDLQGYVAALDSARAAAGTNPRRLAEVTADCERLAEKIRATLARAGC